MRARRSTVLAFLALALVASLIGGLLLSVHRSMERRRGPSHRFPVLPGETFLTDDRAAAVAREAMARDGYAAASWRAIEDDRSKAPDGRPDRFFARNAIDPARGVVDFHFVDDPRRQRSVAVEMRDGEITAQGFWPK